MVVVGDSNITIREPIIRKVLNPAEIHAQPGAAILPGLSSTVDWATELEGLKADVVIINLGINDAALAGEPDTQGFTSYDAKVDDLLALFPEGAEILWSNLPCDLEPPDWRRGCAAVNAALAAAADRWPSLTVVDWAAAARPGHFTDLGSNVHLSPEGGRAWAETIATALAA